MKILAVEFSSPQRSVAVVQSQGQKTLECESTEIIETGARANLAFDMIVQALQQARLEREQVDCLAVGLGPGSYTGIRAAIALAQGWQLARDVKLLGISSVEAIAAQAMAEGFAGRLTVIIDAQRDEFYLASFDLKSERQLEIEPLRLATLAEVQLRQNTGELLVGPEVTEWFPNSRLIFPRASMIGRLALGRMDFVSEEALKPIYLRETQFVKAPPARKFS